MTDFVTTRKIKSLLGLGSHNLESNIEDYKNAIRQANDIIDMISVKTK